MVATGWLQYFGELSGHVIMRTIIPAEILVYYDGVQVFAGHDRIGGHYIGLMVDAQDEVDRYIIAGVEPERLRQFRSGGLDLRSLLLEASDDEWFLTWADEPFGAPLKLELQNGLLSDTDYLPDEGFVLDEVPFDDTTLYLARERHNVVFEFSVDPPESANAHRIRASKLGGLLVHIQTVVRWAYSAAVRELSNRDRDLVDTSEGYLMDVVVPAASGSFKVILEASKPPDMFGYGELARGLQVVDRIFEITTDPKTARDQLQEYKGHLAGSYISLLNFLVEQNTGFRYAWAHPEVDNSRQGGVSVTVAQELVDSLSGNLDLAGEVVSLIGELERVNRRAGDWGLLTNEGSRTGRVDERGPSLDGLEVGRRYRFNCLENLEVDPAGRERRTLYLKEIDSV